jgi:hypothetical protein
MSPAEGDAQIAVENNEVRRLRCGQQSSQANIGFAGPAAELVCEVSSLCSRIGAESNSKKLWRAFTRAA